MIRKALLYSASLLLALALLAPGSSRAVTFFGTGAEGEQIVAAIATAQAAVTNLQQATNNALNMMRTAANPGAYLKALELQHQNLATLNAIQNDLNQIGFTAQNIQRSYNSLFLAGPNALRGLTTPQLYSMNQEWQQHTHASIRAALTTLARVGDVRVNNAETTRVVQQSRDAGGEVAAQIQASNQLLANLSTQISQLTEALVAQGRVSAEAVATATAEKQRNQEINDRSMQDFNKKDPYSLTYRKLP